MQGCYKFEWADTGRATSIIHRSGSTATLPAHVVVTREFELLDNWSDFDATVQLAPTKYVCHELFPAEGLPNIAMYKTTRPPALYAKAIDISAAYHAQLAENRVGELADKCTIVAGAKAARRQDTAARARVARSKASAVKRQARRIVLT